MQLAEVNVLFFWVFSIQLFHHFTDRFLWQHRFLCPHFKRFLQGLSICTEPIACEYLFCLFASDDLLSSLLHCRPDWRWCAIAPDLSSPAATVHGGCCLHCAATSRRNGWS